MKGFHDVRFPLPLAYGVSGGPVRRTQIVSLGTGGEARNTPFAFSRRRWDVGVAIRSLDQLETLLSFYEARRGPLYAFRFRDPMDSQTAPRGHEPSASDCIQAIGDGARTRFSLVKTYTDSAGSASRPIVCADADSLLVSVDGAPQTLNAEYTYTEGVLAFVVPPVGGAIVSAGFRFDVPVRFDTEQLSISVQAFEAGDVPSIPLVEVLYPVDVDTPGP